ncbi:MAG: D-alanyl-D-alanine carboxypeptidase [Ruminococcaceae bacterium]|nr:D-alanyl-D-alanine carboxypeptidase [Oscillospiraceae bacterium]
MLKKRYVTSLLTFIIIFSFLISIPFSASADEEKSYEEAKAALKADMEDPFYIETVESAYLYCLSTETELLSFDASPETPDIPSETVKLLTALTAYDMIDDLSEKVTVTSTMVYRSTGIRYGFAAGDVVTYSDLLCTLLMRNANDAAVILAYSLCGGTDEFAEKMNEKAISLGLTSSTFTNPTGLHDIKMKTTAKDIFLLAYEFYANETLMNYSGAYSKKLSINDTIYNRNYLISSYYNTGKSYIDSTVSGMISGSSTEGGHVLVRSATYDGYEYICVILGAQRDSHFIYSYDISAELIKWGSKNYSFLKILDNSTPVASVPVINGRESDSVPVVPSDNISKYLLSDAYSSGKVTSEIKLNVENFTAPITMGTEVGEIFIYYNGELIAESKLKTACDITENTTSAAIQSVWTKLSSEKAIKAYIITVSCVAVYIFINSIIRQQRKNKLAARGIK